MFSTYNTIITILAIFLSLGFIMFSIYSVNKLLDPEHSKDTLVKFILLIFTALVSVWIIDKVVAYKTNLLSDDMDKELFDLIKTLTLMIFSFYFGTKTKDAS